MRSRRYLCFYDVLPALPIALGAWTLRAFLLALNERTGGLRRASMVAAAPSENLTVVITVKYRYFLNA
jgi:hypothetical protein